MVGLGRARSRRRGLVVGAAIGSSRAKKASATQQQEQPHHAPTQGSGNGESIEQLKQLAQLKDQGMLTQEEFDAKKRQILGL